jgi:hypothetical protein
LVTVKTSVFIPYKILALSYLLLEDPQHHNSTSFRETYYESQFCTSKFHIICINNIDGTLINDVGVTLATLNLGLWKGIRVNGIKYGAMSNICLGSMCGEWKQIWQPWILDMFAEL